MKSYRAISEVWFVCGGLAFIVMCPLLFTMQGVKSDREIKKERERVESAIDYREWKSGNNCFYWFNKAAPLRHYLLNISDERKATEIKNMPAEVVRALILHLENRPAPYEHDIECIRLLGMLKNYAAAVDKAESERIIEELPKLRQDKSC